MIILAKQISFRNDVGGTEKLKGSFRVEIQKGTWDDELGIILHGHLTEPQDISKTRTIGMSGFKPEDYTIHGRNMVESVRKAQKDFDPTKVEVLPRHCNLPKVGNLTFKPFMDLPKNGKIKNALREARKQIGMSQIALCQQAHISQSTLSLAENSLLKLSGSSMQRIAQALGCPVSDINPQGSIFPCVVTKLRKMNTEQLKRMNQMAKTVLKGGAFLGTNNRLF